MSETKFVVIIKSPNDNIPNYTVECHSNWIVRDLKNYLSENYSSNPPVSSQRLIHCGKLLKDDVQISSLFTLIPDPQVIHIICPSVTSVSNRTPDPNIGNISEGDLQKYKHEYFQYLQQFYMRNLNFNHGQQISAPSIIWPMYFGAGTYCPMGPSIRSTPHVNNDNSSNRPVENALGWRQRVRSFLRNLGLENQNADQLTEEDERRGAQWADAGEQRGVQQVMMMDNPMANGLVDDFGDGMGNMDIIDRFYMVFRFCLFVGLCFAYSSLDKALIVFSVAAYVYLYNVYRRYAAIERAVQAQAPNRQQVNSQNNQASSNQPNADSTPSDHDNHLQQQVSQPDASSSEDASSIAVEPQPRVRRLTANIRTFASASYHFFSALITSIIPEQPPPIHFD